LASRGFAPERREFRPHLTLARKVTHGPSPAAVEPLAWPVNEITLVESTTDPTGSRYTRLEAWPLGR
jgi:2'-5' RNA ligase